MVNWVLSWLLRILTYPVENAVKAIAPPHHMMIQSPPTIVWWPFSIYMFTCLYVCIYIHVYKCICVCMYIYIHICTCISVYPGLRCMDIYMYMYMYMYICVYVCIYKYIWMHQCLSHWECCRIDQSVPWHRIVSIHPPPTIIWWPISKCTFVCIYVNIHMFICRCLSHWQYRRGDHCI